MKRITLSIAEAYQRFKDSLLSEIADGMESSREGFPSPDVTDLITWNVIIAFFVSLAATATYPVLSDQLANYGRITRLNLVNAGSELNAKVSLSLEGELSAAREQIAVILQEYAIPEEKRLQIADRVIAILSEGHTA